MKKDQPLLQDHETTERDGHESVSWRGKNIYATCAKCAFFFLTGRAKKFPTETKESRAEHSFTYFFNSQTPFSVGALNNQKKKKKITERRIAQS